MTWPSLFPRPRRLYTHSTLVSGFPSRWREFPPQVWEEVFEPGTYPLCWDGCTYKDQSVDCPRFTSLWSPPDPFSNNESTCYLRLFPVFTVWPPFSLFLRVTLFYKGRGIRPDQVSGLVTSLEESVCSSLSPTTDVLWPVHPIESLYKIRFSVFDLTTNRDFLED